MCATCEVNEIETVCVICGGETLNGSATCDDHCSCAMCGEGRVGEQAHDARWTDDGYVCEDCYNSVGLCEVCRGSGEGMYDGSKCRNCGGSGDGSHYSNSSREDELADIKYDEWKDRQRDEDY